MDSTRASARSYRLSFQNTVLADHEIRLALRDGGREVERTMITTCDPTLPTPHLIRQLEIERSLIGMVVRANDEIFNEFVVKIQNRHRMARQRCILHRRSSLPLGALQREDLFISTQETV
jgi:hypothetical protein